ncbi:CLUMA_CG012559, isoform A [Clunio marinus]|uniref:Protein wntless n=1 Tax=Clunio marinus TaxID=568069 RepID=A0A1J1IGA0_9DIPT|nr:CLUMA_CG012559, isoform A [Clunio marinus]
MSGTILENLSGKKLTILVSFLLFCQLICFLIGGLLAPVPSNVQTIIGTICKDRPGSHNDTSIWLYSRGGKKCEVLDHNEIREDSLRMANKLVFVFQMPLPRGGQNLDYSRWQQNLIGILQADIAYDPKVYNNPQSEITLDLRLAYRNKGDPDDEWKYYASSLEKRDLTCEVDNATDKYLYQCDTIPVFEMGSLHHDFYLLNVRIPVDSDQQMNLNIGYIQDLNLATIYQNGGFTKVWVSLKTTFFPFIVAIMIWFWHRVHMLQRKPVLLEYMLIYLGAALTFLNLPLEYLTLFVEMKFMLLLSDVRQGIFYAMLCSFWLVFAGEHMLIQESGEKNSLKIYWRHLMAVVIGCISLFLFDICERGVQLRNPFYSIWVSRFGSRIAMTFIVLGAISAAIYFLFLCYMVWKVFNNISIKRSILPSMSKMRRLHYEGIIYRFKFLMLATLLCALLTVIGFILGQVTDSQWHWNDNVELEFSSAFFTGVYGMWNIYIFALIILYAPSHKKWPANETQENIMGEEIEFNNLPSDTNPSEISSLTQFARKTALD